MFGFFVTCGIPKVMQIIVEIWERVQGTYSAKWQRNPIPQEWDKIDVNTNMALKMVSILYASFQNIDPEHKVGSPSIIYLWSQLKDNVLQ